MMHSSRKQWERQISLKGRETSLPEQAVSANASIHLTAFAGFITSEMKHRSQRCANQELGKGLSRAFEDC